MLAVRDVWASDDFNGPFAEAGNAGRLALDAQMWFTGYLILELGLSVFLRHIGTELVVHHFVFGIISVIVLYRGGLTGIVGALLAQELSSPALNVFMFVRGFYGADGAARIWLIIFIVIFIPVRLVLAGVCSAGFVASWLNPAWSASKPWTPAYAAWEQVVEERHRLDQHLAVKANWQN